MTRIKIEVPSNDPIALSALGEALQRIATERNGGQPLTREEIGDSSHKDDKFVHDLDVNNMYLNRAPNVKPDNTTNMELKDDVTKREGDLVTSSDIMEEELKHVDDTTEQYEAGGGVEDDTLDKDGLPWDKRIHSRGKTRLADDTWRLARKPNDKTQEEWDEYVASVKAELKAVQDIPVPSDTVTPPVVDEQGPFYWSHDESSSCGKVETLEELHEMVPGDGLVTQIDEESYNQRVEAGYDNGEQAPTETLTPPVVETETVTPPTLDERAVADVQASEPVAAVEPPTSVTAPVVDNTPSVSTFQELMKYITSDAAKRGATNDMIKEVLAQVDPSLTAIPLIANRADLIPTFVAKLEAKLS